MKLDRRSDLRLSQSFPLVIVPQKLEKRQFRWAGEVDECSAHGLRFRCVHRMNPGEAIQLCLYPPDLFVPVQMRARIAWCNFISETNSYAYGVEIEELDPDYAVAFHSFIARLKVHNKPSWRHISIPLRRFLYKRLLKPIVNLSKLGRTSIGARADSGVNFDHIYGNRANGSGPIGRLMDRVLLQLPASKATRQRKLLLEDLVRGEIARRMSYGMKTRIVDLGSGPSRYILENIGPEMLRCVELLCIDRDRDSLKLGKSLGTDKPVRFVRGDIFQLEHLCQLARRKQWAPDLIIASGIIYYYEDQWVKRLFEKVFQWTARNGTFIVTNLVHNPNRRLIAELAMTQQGQPWIPIARPSHLVRQWLVEAGYDNIQLTHVPKNMYAVFTSRKAATSPDLSATEIRKFRISSTGAILKGRLHLPSGKISGPPIIFIHGLGYCTDFYDLDRNAFLSRGFPFLEFNLRGHATSTGRFTLDSAVDDLDTIRQFLSKEGLGEEALYLAHSVGALIGFMSAVRTRGITAIGSINVVTSMADSFQHWFQSGYIAKVRNDYTIAGKIPPGIAKFLQGPDSLKRFEEGIPSRDELSFPMRYGLLKLPTVYEFFKQIVESPDLLQMAEKKLPPTLFIQGDYDEVISTERTAMLFHQIKGPRDRLVRFPAKDHFHTGLWPQICEQAAVFFEKSKDKS